MKGGALVAGTGIRISDERLRIELDRRLAARRLRRHYCRRSHRLWLKMNGFPETSGLANSLAMEMHWCGCGKIPKMARPDSPAGA